MFVTSCCLVIFVCRDARVVKDMATGKSKGYGFVSFFNKWVSRRHVSLILLLMRLGNTLCLRILSLSLCILTFSHRLLVGLFAVLLQRCTLDFMLRLSVDEIRLFFFIPGCRECHSAHGGAVVRRQTDSN